MNARLLPVSIPELRTPAAHPPSAARLSGRVLVIARAVWMTCGVILLVIFVANVPALFRYARTVCALPDAGNCPPEQFTPAYVWVLGQLHLPLAGAQLTLAAACVAISVFYWLLGMLIFWRKSDEWVGLLISLLLVMFGATGFLGFNMPTPTPTLFELLAQFITHWLMWPAMLASFFTFPTGRFAPRWTWIAFMPFFVVTMLASLPLSMGTARLVPGIVIILSALMPIAVQAYRYARVYNAVQRQQTKWFVTGLAAVFLLIFLQGILQAAASDFSGANTVYQIVNGPFWLLPWTVLLLCVSIPILRYRLWDIDVLINRTLVYGSLTGILAAVYLVLVVGAQSSLHVLTGQHGDEPVLIVASTLLIAALFNPLRRRIQATIDRRFYRRKYDASITQKAFGATLSQHVELSELSANLVALVEETMHPAHVSLWLRTDVRGARSNQGVAEAGTGRQGDGIMQRTR